MTTVTPKKNKLRFALRWIGWVLLVQVVLINIMSAIYAYKLTHFYPAADAITTKPDQNIFSKTWKIFTGPKYYKSIIPEVPNVPFDTVSLKTKSGLKIAAWYIPADSTAKGTVILVHGLSSNRTAMMHEFYEFRYRGYNTMLVDLRAHGASDGSTTTIGFAEDEEVKLCYDYVAAKGEKKIILYGLSLGAVAITKAMYDYHLKPAAIILDAPFENMQEHFKARARVLGFPSQPFAALVTCWTSIERGFNGFKHSTVKYAAAINCPVVLEYGVKDPWVLPAEVQEIFKAIPSKQKKLVSYENGDHGSFVLSDKEKWRNEMTALLQ